MPRVACGKCSRELDYGDGDRPLFCAYCGQSLGTPLPGPIASVPTTIEHSPRSDGRGDETIDFVPRPGAAPKRDIPERVKGYRLIRQLGRGGMGTVFEAEDSRHGGISFKLAGLGLVRRDGRPAPRWRCAWRSLVVWLPPSALLIASAWARWLLPGLEWALFGLAASLPPLSVASALISPSCGPHDRLSGLRVVPR